jgi:predicted outer membrane protein
MRIKTRAGLATLAMLLVAAAPNQQPPGDAEAIAFVVAIDSGEMMLADVAIGKNPTDAFKNYVTDLREDHKEHLSATLSEASKASVSPGKWDVVDTLKAKTMDAHHKVMGKTGAEFEKAFLDEMITAHTTVLQTINTKFVDARLSSGIQKEMDHLKRMVEEHLNKAKVLRNG